MPCHDIDERFAEAWVNRDHVVARARLRPFSQWHVLQLSLLRNPLVQEELRPTEIVRWEHLWQAVAVCQTQYGERPKFLSGFRAAFRQALFRLDLAREVAAFRAYQADFYTVPELTVEETPNERALTAPGMLARVVFVMRHLGGFSHDELWSMPVGQLLWIEATLSEQISDRVALLGKAEGDIWALLGRIQRGEADESELPPDMNRDKTINEGIDRAKEALGL